MSKDQKRYRQINILESFALSKKTKKDPVVPSMQKNLRDLMAAAAEKRVALPKINSHPGKSSFHSSNKCLDGSSTSTVHDRQSEMLQIPDSDKICLPRLTTPKINSVPEKSFHNSSTDHGEASTSTVSNLESEMLLIPDSEESCMPCSAELFPSSNELFPDSPLVEQCSSQETINTDIIDSSPCSPDSPEIFSIEECDDEVDSQVDDDDSTEIQDQLSYLNRTPDCSIRLPQLEPLENHSIMFSPHIRPGDAPRPYPSSYRDKWDFHHVRMPCSPLNRYPVEDLLGEKQIRSRWDLICISLQRHIQSSQDLENAIMQYNSQYRGKWNFNGLHTFFSQSLTEDERGHFFENILPSMISMALNLPNICTQPIPLLKKDKDHSVTMSQKQIACLLLNAFFCTFPRRNFQSRFQKQRWNNEYSSYPDINFNRLFFGVKNKHTTNTEKIMCLINYFRRVTSKEPAGTVTFHRQSLQQLPKWHKSTKGIGAVVIRSDGLIESEGHGMLQVDFANKFVGGGVLGHGCVQEEIRFIICPELIVSRLFVECLDDSEVLIITGIEQYNKYSGYSDTFKWEGNFHDQTPRDTWGRRCTQIVAMDAKHFTNPAEQFKLSSIIRELNKAYCGFYENALPVNLSAVASGNWGCGAFNGNPSLKFIIQLMAASQTGRDLLYFTFGNKALKRELKIICSFLLGNNLLVGDLCKILISYGNTVKVVRKDLYPKMSDFLCALFSDENDIEDASDNNQESDITDSDKNAIQKLIEAVDEDSNTEIEDDCPVNDAD